MKIKVTNTESQKSLLILKWIVAICWIGLCFFLSWQGGEDTANTSLTLTGWIHHFFHVLNLNLDLDMMHYYIRKAAHVILFGMGTFFFWYALYQRGRSFFQSNERKLIRSVMIYSLICLACEAGKVFIDGRHFDVADLGLDLIGVFLIYVFVDIWLKSRMRIRRKSA